MLLRGVAEKSAYDVCHVTEFRQTEFFLKEELILIWGILLNACQSQFTYLQNGNNNIFRSLMKMITYTKCLKNSKNYYLLYSFWARDIS